MRQSMLIFLRQSKQMRKYEKMLFLKNFIFVQPCALLGHTIAEYLNYKEHPKFYELLGKPWYSELYFKIAASAITVLVTLIVYLIINAKIKTGESENGNN